MISDVRIISLALLFLMTIVNLSVFFYADNASAQDGGVYTGDSEKDPQDESGDYSD